MTSSHPDSDQEIVSVGQQDLLLQKSAKAVIEHEPTVPDLQTKLFKKTENDQHVWDGEARKTFFGMLMLGGGCFSLFMMLVICLAGFGLWSFFLSDKVLITLIGGTSANIFILMRIVAKYLFSENAVHRNKWKK